MATPPVPVLLALLVCCAASSLPRAQSDAAQKLKIDVWSSGRTEAFPLDFSTSSLGSGGLFERAKWAKAGRIVGPGRFETRGGARIEIRAGRCEIACPSGTRLAIDGRGRIHGDGRALTSFAQFGLSLRFHDGAELQILTGNERAARRVSVIDNGVEHILARKGAPQAGRVRARKPVGSIYYLCGHGDEIVSLCDVGPMILVRPVLVRARSKAPRIVLMGDLLRDAAEQYLESLPKRRVQYPNAQKIAELLVKVSRHMFPPDEAVRGTATSLRNVPLQVAFGTQIRMDLTNHGKRGWGGLACGLRLAPEAERSLEFVSFVGGTTMHRVLPKSRQRFSRYLGRGIDFAKITNKLLPWRLPLAQSAQRKKTLRVLSPWLPFPRDVQVQEASVIR